MRSSAIFITSYSLVEAVARVLGLEVGSALAVVAERRFFCAGSTFFSAVLTRDERRTGGAGEGARSSLVVRARFGAGRVALEEGMPSCLSSFTGRAECFRFLRLSTFFGKASDFVSVAGRAGGSGRLLVSSLTSVDKRVKLSGELGLPRLDRALVGYVSHLSACVVKKTGTYSDSSSRVTSVSRPMKTLPVGADMAIGTIPAVQEVAEILQK